jgi:carbon monoxide dehydrogenase subunit G
MLHFEGDKDLSQTPAEVSAKLADARFLVQCIPGVEKVSVAEAQRAVCTLRPGFSFVRGTLDVTLVVVENAPPTSTRLSLHSKGIGTTSDVEVVLAYTSQDAGTRVHWTADIKQLGGLLKAVPPGLIKGAAQKVIDEMWANVEGKFLLQHQAEAGA